MLPVALAEVPHEASDDVGARARQRVEERPRVTSAEEAAGVRDPEAPPRPVGQRVEVVEVAAVGDHADGAARSKHLHLAGDRLGHADDRVGVAGNEPCEGALAADLVPPVGVLDERVAQIGDPAGAGGALRSEA